MPVERRRYFRITDHIGLSFRILDPRFPDLKLPKAPERFETIEKLEHELDEILDTVWASNPVYAKAISLLNQKIDLLLGDSKPTENDVMENFDHHFSELDVSLSACGIAFTTNVKVKTHDRLELLLLLGAAKSRIIIKGTIVNVDEKELGGEKVYFTCVDFDIEVQKREKLIQYIVKRQVEYIGQQKEVL